MTVRVKGVSGAGHPPSHTPGDRSPRSSWPSRNCRRAGSPACGCMSRGRPPPCRTDRGAPCPDRSAGRARVHRDHGRDSRRSAQVRYPGRRRASSGTSGSSRDRAGCVREGAVISGLVKKEQFHGVGILRIDAEIDSALLHGRPQRKTVARVPDQSSPCPKVSCYRPHRFGIFHLSPARRLPSRCSRSIRGWSGPRKTCPCGPHSGSTCAIHRSRSR